MGKVNQSLGYFNTENVKKIILGTKNQSTRHFNTETVPKNIMGTVTKSIRYFNTENIIKYGYTEPECRILSHRKCQKNIVGTVNQSAGYFNTENVNNQKMGIVNQSIRYFNTVEHPLTSPSCCIGTGTLTGNRVKMCRVDRRTWNQILHTFKPKKYLHSSLLLVSLLISW